MVIKPPAPYVCFDFTDLIHSFLYVPSRGGFAQTNAQRKVGKILEISYLAVQVIPGHWIHPHHSGLERDEMAKQRAHAGVWIPERDEPEAFGLTSLPETDNFSLHNRV